MPRKDRRSMNSLAHRPRVATGFGIVVLMGLPLAGCTGGDGRVTAAGPQNAAVSTSAAESAGAAATAPNPLRNVYFGDLHTRTPTSPTTRSSTAPGPPPTTPTATRRANR